MSPEATPWRARAACWGRVRRGRDPWFPAADHDPRPNRGDGEAAEAIAVCRRCPVREDCLAEAMATEAGRGIVTRPGIFGGLTPRQRFNKDRAERRSA